MNLFAIIHYEPPLDGVEKGVSGGCENTYFDSDTLGPFYEKKNKNKKRTIYKNNWHEYKAPKRVE